MFTTSRPVPEDYAPALLKPALDGLEAKQTPDETGPDTFPIFKNDPLADRHRVVSRYIVGANGKYSILKRREFKVRDIDGASEMLDSDITARFRFLVAVVTRELWYWKHAVKYGPLNGTRIKGWQIVSDPLLYPLKPLAQALLRNLEGPMPYDQLVQLTDAVSIPSVGQSVREYVPLEKLVPLITSTVAREGLDDAMLEAVENLRKKTELSQWDQGSVARNKRDLAEQLDAILKPGAKKSALEAIEPGEPWSDAALSQLRGNSGKAWRELIAHAADSDASQPSQKWQKTAKQLVDAIGADAFQRTLLEWLELMLKPRETPLTEEQLREIAFGFHQGSADVYSKRNEPVMKGLAWIAGTLDRSAFAASLGAMAERCYKKIPQIGPRSAKIANACLVALTMMNGPQAAAQLSRLKAIVKQPTGRKMIDKALARLATRQNVTVDDLEEQTVPTYGLVDGVSERKLGSTTLRIALMPLAEVEQSWQTDGKPRKSPPAELKKRHAAELKAIKRELADLDKTLTAQRLRIERLFLRRTPWKLDAWMNAYHDHPVVRFFSRRLIWSFADSEDATPITVAWDGKRFVDASDHPVKLDPTKTLVRLWHPSSSKPDQVLAWRNWLAKHEITQPFKQAHREIYLLTDAERRTETHSNRFAQHILRQHQFQALCTQRGWKYQLMGGFDFHNFPTLQIPLWNAKIEFWVNLAEEGGLAASGIATHLATDQVRFLDPTTDKPMKLADVPALLLSEVFRDVDLFVGVASVANDPNWTDENRERRHHTYWRNYITADLTETGRTRREVLETLLPRLTRLTGKWTLADKFLVVKGTLRTYKIHLGSGNILMEPNDQYLCIVPDRPDARDRVFLPFEGDTTLSIILSKAFLLADDAKIDDPSIMRQIKTGDA